MISTSLMTRRALPLLMMSIAIGPAVAAANDPTATSLQRCLDDPANGSTAGQTTCEAGAAANYDRRLNQAYRQLLKRLPLAPAQRLREAQRAWLSFRAADSKARAALYATRNGTMYVPMQAHGETDALRDRALQLETYLRVIQIER